jgi:hypothetical protein
MASKVTSERLQTGEKFSTTGKICGKIGILVQGLLYASYVHEESIDEIVSRFFYSPKNVIVTSFESFTRKKIADESIIALEDSFLICITKNDLDQAFALSPSIERLGRIIAEESYIQASERIRSLQILKAKERIGHFRVSHPELVNRPSISTQQLASYLGMHRNVYTKNANKC